MPDPPTNQTSPLLARATASSRLATHSMPGAAMPRLVTTMLRLSGSALPIDSKVFLPMMTVVRKVTRLKPFQSPGWRQGIVPLFPMTPSGETAKMMPLIALDRDLERSGRGRVVPPEHELLHHTAAASIAHRPQVVQRPN